MADELSRLEYQNEVRSIVDNVMIETRSDNPDLRGDSLREAVEERLWETIDGHQWIIYTHYNYQILQHSDNDGYAIQEWGPESAIRDGQLHTAGLAFGALYADCMEYLSNVDWDWDPTDEEEGSK